MWKCHKCGKPVYFGEFLATRRSGVLTLTIMLLVIWSSAIDLPHYRTSWVLYETLSYILHCE